MITQEKGRVAEARALAYLKKQNLNLVMKNYRSRFGEIDLIMSDNDVLVFIEVRSRASKQFGGALSSITEAKKKKIVKTATYFIMEHQHYKQSAFRFDVVSIDGPSAMIDWIKNAFGVDY